MYGVRADMVARFGESELIQLTDRNGTGVIDDGVLEQALRDAAAEIDSYLAARYSLPLPVTPLLLISKACDLARYALWADGASEAIQKRRDDAIAWLRAVARGDADLGLPAATTPSTSNLAEVVSAGRVWDRKAGGFL